MRVTQCTLANIIYSVITDADVDFRDFVASPDDLTQRAGGYRKLMDTRIG